MSENNLQKIVIDNSIFEKKFENSVTKKKCKRSSECLLDKYRIYRTILKVFNRGFRNVSEFKTDSKNKRHLNVNRCMEDVISFIQQTIPKRLVFRKTITFIKKAF